MNEHRTHVGGFAPRRHPAVGCLDNVTELLQATGVAGATGSARLRPGGSCPREQSEDWGEVMAALARQARVIVPRTVVGHRRARSAAGSLLDRLPLVTPAPALGPVGAECRPTR